MSANYILILTTTLWSKHYNYFINIYFILYFWNWGKRLRVYNDKVVEHVFEHRESGFRVQTYKHYAILWPCPKSTNWQVTKLAIILKTELEPRSFCSPPLAKKVLMSAYNVPDTKYSYYSFFNLPTSVCMTIRDVW